jgi:hypothetical protein
MIDKFKKIHHFLKEMWLGFEAVAQMKEVVEKPQRPADLLRLSVKKILKLKTLKELDDAPLSNHPIRNFDFCEEITKNKETIKLKALDYAERIIELYYKVTSKPILLQNRN